RGWQTRFVEAEGTERQRTTSMQYDLAGNLDQVVRPREYDGGNVLAGTGEPTTATTSYAYDVVNRRTPATEGAGSAWARPTETGYDAADNVPWVLAPRAYAPPLTDPVIAGPQRVRPSYASASMSRRTTIIEAFDQPELRRTTTTAYDLAGNVRWVTDPLG